jgi:succinoglycan biosynthesis transport protein ExoP
VSSTQPQDFTIRDLLKIFGRRRQTIILVAGSILILAICASLFKTRRYTASSTIQLQKSSSDGLNLDSLMGSAGGGAGDSLSVNVDLQTQSNILKSEALAVEVIEQLNLEQNQDFSRKPSLLGRLSAALSPKGPDESGSRTLENSPRRRSAAVSVFSSNLNVKVVAGTRLLQVDYTNPDPKVAAAVVNRLVQALIDYTFQTKFKATNEVSGWLEVQLNDLRKQSEEQQKKVVELQKDTGLFGVGGSDLQGKPITYSPVLDSLQQTTAMLSQAQMNRVLKAAVNQVVRTGNAELISQLSGTSVSNGTSPGVANSLALIQSLRTQEATLQEQISKDSVVYGAAFPRLIEEKASLQGVEGSLHDEIARMATRADNDLRVAEQAEAGARRAYEAQRLAATKLNDKTIVYSITAKEANQSQELYQDLLKRLREAGILEGLRSSNVTVVDRANPPAYPTVPNRRLYLLIGLGGGLLAGILAALLVDAIDNTVRGPEEVEALGLIMLGMLPKLPANANTQRLMIVDRPASIFAEAVRALRSVVLLSRSDKPPQVILVTSSTPGEGKTTISLNLSASLAQQGKTVLLLECDLRRPTMLAKLGEQPSASGMSVLLSNGSAQPEPTAVEAQPNFYLIPAGPIPPFPTELLGSQRMLDLLARFREQYDFIVIDSPPILPVADSRVLARIVDTIVVVARADRTSRIALRRAMTIINQHVTGSSSVPVGAVLNSISTRSSAYYSYYGSRDEYYQEGVKK